MLYLTVYFLLCAVLSIRARASPTGLGLAAEITSFPLYRRADPYFPDTPISCPICAKDYANINSCAQAAPVLANFSMIIFNPGAFIDIIMCACGDTFQAAFPQCVDCFIQTDQQNVLSTPDLPGLVDGMRKICALKSTLLGNVSGVNGYVTPTTQAPIPTSTSSSTLTSDQSFLTSSSFLFLGIAVMLGGVAL